ncbi:unnamed protein product [Prorocentrum cordatum]|uniref:RRM domain-containing protein n=1 Tax=Prorocentrum cordatum TaxID=2364126 RepID=A0ABN9YEB5_9DINO|nr:unnamed protein product [Polarella glacialis]
MDKDAVYEHFRPCGQIDALFLLRDWWTQASKGICFITFADQGGVEAALKHDGTELEGQKLRVNLAADRDGLKGKGGGRGSGKSPGDGQQGGSGRGYGKSQGKGRGGGAPATLALGSQPPEGCRGLLVRGLAWWVTEESLRSFFGKCGEGPTRVRVLKEKSTGESKGKAFVDFADAAAVEEAMKLNCTPLDGWKLRLEFAMSRSV